MVATAAHTARKADKLAAQIVRRFQAQCPPLVQQPNAIGTALTALLSGPDMHSTVHNITRTMRGCSTKLLGNIAYGGCAADTSDSSTAAGRLLLQARAFLETEQLGLSIPTFESVFTEELDKHSIDESEAELGRRIESSGASEYAGLATYYRIEDSASFLQHRHKSDAALESEELALVRARGVMCSTPSDQPPKGPSLIDRSVQVAPHSAGLPDPGTQLTAKFWSHDRNQPLGLETAKYRVYARVCTQSNPGVSELIYLGTTDNRPRRPRATTAQVLVSLQEGLMELPQGDIVLLFDKLQYFSRDNFRARMRHILADWVLSRDTLSTAPPIAIAGLWTIQGPPGTGKTHLLADVIAELHRSKLKVAVTGPNHNGLDNMDSQLQQRGVVTYRIKKQRTLENALRESSLTCAVVIATTFQFVKTEKHFDVLIVDEASQLSFSDFLVAAGAATAWCLAGDDAQLPYVSHAKHSGCADLSALGQATRLSDQSRCFMLGTSSEFGTRRMCPPIRKFISDNFYSGKLVGSGDPTLNLQQQRVIGSKRFDGNGIRAVLIEDGNASLVGKKSQAQAQAVVEVVQELLSAGVSHMGADVSTDNNAGVQALKASDVIIVAPFNAQVNLLTARLKAVHGLHGVQVGTVDKFQGREAAIVIFSMTKCDDFAADPQRLNVAVSRAKTLCVVVACAKGLERLNQDFNLSCYSTVA
jgi:hypothetical protein